MRKRRKDSDRKKRRKKHEKVKRRGKMQGSERDRVREEERN